jgi:hypothetical protein
VSPLRRALWPRATSRERAAAALVAALPAYQVALWPDGWELLADGSVSVRDTHAMAEARRWYELGRRNRAGWVPGRALATHGVFIPPAILDLARRTFASEQAASVAVQLVAGDWVGQRRAQLLRWAGAALAERAGVWTGSRHGLAMDAAGLRALVTDVLGLCVGEGLIPRAQYGLKVRRDDGFGVCGYCVRVETLLEPYARARVGDALAIALIPWNRAVGRDGGPSLVISVEVGGGGPRHQHP